MIPGQRKHREPRRDRQVNATKAPRQRRPGDALGQAETRAPDRRGQQQEQDADPGIPDLIRELLGDHHKRPTHGGEERPEQAETTRSAGCGHGAMDSVYDVVSAP